MPGALFAAVQPMRAAKARRSPLAYGWLAHEIPDEVTAAWVQPFLDDADIRRDAAAFMRAIDKATMLDAAARLPSLKIPSLVAWGQDDRFFPPELGERLAAALGARSPIAGARTFVAEDEPDASPTSSALRARGRGAGGLRRQLIRGKEAWRDCQTLSAWSIRFRCDTQSTACAGAAWPRR